MSLVSRQVTEQLEERVTTRTEYSRQRTNGVPLSNGHSGSLHSKEADTTSNVVVQNLSPTLNVASPNGTLRNNRTVVSRIVKEQSSQRETKVTEIVREFRQMGPDGHQMDYSTLPRQNQMNADYAQTTSGYGTTPRNHFHPPPPPQSEHPPFDPHNLAQDPYFGRGNAPPEAEYLRQAGGYPPASYEDIDGSVGPPARPDYLSPGGSGAHPANYEDDRMLGGAAYSNWNNINNMSHYGNLPVRPYLLGSGSVENNHSESLQKSPVPNNVGSNLHLQSPSMLHYGNHIGDDPSDPNLVNASSPGVRWRDPDLHEVIQFLGNPNPVVKANAAAYLQHLCYMDDPVKAKTRALGGIPPLVALLSHEQPEVHRNACGALRNLSYGRQNDENKKAIKSAGGIPSLVRLLKRTPDNEVKELVTGVLWNLSSCEELKKPIIDDGIIALVNTVIIPHSGWDRNNMGPSPSHAPDACWSTVFKNASGVLRNVSSAGEYARKKLRECEGVVEALLHVVRCALSRADIDDKSVENSVCTLRNLSYRCQEVEDPNYDKHPPPTQTRATAVQAKGENPGCFGANKKKKEAALASASPKESQQVNNTTAPARSSSQNRSEPVKGMELLWQPEVVQAYLALLSNCSNPETLEAAAGAIQNLAACYWQPSIEIRAAVRKEKGLPVLVELLRMEVDRVVCAVATALRNLALDQRNKELIGKYAMRDLVQKLPSGRPQDQGTSDDTIAAVLATLNEVIKKNAEFARSLMEAEGVERLVVLTQQKRRYSPRVVKFASQVLYSMWQHQELREVYKKAGWTEQDFVSKGASARGSSPGPGSSGEPGSAGSPVNANSTLNRPMASQSGTRYEDKTMQRGPNNSVPKSPPPAYPQGDEVPLADMRYPEGGSHAPPLGAYQAYANRAAKPGEPLYAQVNREKKRNRHFEGNSRGYGGYSGSPSGEPGGPHHPAWADGSNTVTIDNLSQQPAGDSWV